MPDLRVSIDPDSAGERVTVRVVRDGIGLNATEVQALIAALGVPVAPGATAEDRGYILEVPGSDSGRRARWVRDEDSAFLAGLTDLVAQNQQNVSAAHLTAETNAIAIDHLNDRIGDLEIEHVVSWADATGAETTAGYRFAAPESFSVGGSVDWTPAQAAQTASNGNNRVLLVRVPRGVDPTHTRIVQTRAGSVHATFPREGQDDWERVTVAGQGDEYEAYQVVSAGVGTAIAAATDQSDRFHLQIGQVESLEDRITQNAAAGWAREGQPDPNDALTSLATTVGAQGSSIATVRGQAETNRQDIAEINRTLGTVQSGVFEDATAADTTAGFRWAVLDSFSRGQAVTWLDAESVYAAPSNQNVVVVIRTPRGLHSAASRIIQTDGADRQNNVYPGYGHDLESTAVADQGSFDVWHLVDAGSGSSVGISIQSGHKLKLQITEIDSLEDRLKSAESALDALSGRVTNDENSVHALPFRTPNSLDDQLGWAFAYSYVDDTNFSGWLATSGRIQVSGLTLQPGATQELEVHLRVPKGTGPGNARIDWDSIGSYWPPNSHTTWGAINTGEVPAGQRSATTYDYYTLRGPTTAPVGFRSTNATTFDIEIRDTLRTIELKQDLLAADGGGRGDDSLIEKLYDDTVAGSAAIFSVPGVTVANNPNQAYYFRVGATSEFTLGNALFVAASGSAITVDGVRFWTLADGSLRIGSASIDKAVVVWKVDDVAAIRTTIQQAGVERTPGRDSIRVVDTLPATTGLSVGQLAIIRDDGRLFELTGAADNTSGRVDLSPAHYDDTSVTESWGVTIPPFDSDLFGRFDHAPTYAGQTLPDLLGFYWFEDAEDDGFFFVLVSQHAWSAAGGDESGMTDGISRPAADSPIHIVGSDGTTTVAITLNYAIFLTFGGKRYFRFSKLFSNPVSLSAAEQQFVTWLKAGTDFHINLYAAGDANSNHLDGFPALGWTELHDPLAISLANRIAALEAGGGSGGLNQEQVDTRIATLRPSNRQLPVYEDLNGDALVGNELLAYDLNEEEAVWKGAGPHAGSQTAYFAPDGNWRELPPEQSQAVQHLIDLTHDIKLNYDGNTWVDSAADDQVLVWITGDSVGGDDLITAWNNGLFSHMSAAGSFTSGDAVFFASLEDLSGSELNRFRVELGGNASNIVSLPNPISFGNRADSNNNDVRFWRARALIHSSGNGWKLQSNLRVDVWDGTLGETPLAQVRLQNHGLTLEHVDAIEHLNVPSAFADSTRVEVAFLQNQVGDPDGSALESATWAARQTVTGTNVHGHWAIRLPIAVDPTDPEISRGIVRIGSPTPNINDTPFHQLANVHTTAAYRYYILENAGSFNLASGSSVIKFQESDYTLKVDTENLDPGTGDNNKVFKVNEDGTAVERGLAGLDSLHSQVKNLLKGRGLAPVVLATATPAGGAGVRIVPLGSGATADGSIVKSLNASHLTNGRFTLAAGVWELECEVQLDGTSNRASPQIQLFDPATSTILTRSHSAFLRDGTAVMTETYRLKIHLAADTEVVIRIGNSQSGGGSNVADGTFNVTSFGTKIWPA